MTFPTGQSVPTANLDSGSDNPGSARANLLLAVQLINTIIADANAANGVAVLNGSAKLESSQIPNTFSPTGILTLSPVDNVVKIEDVLRLQVQSTDTVLNIVGPAAGDIAYVSNGNAGSPCLAVYNGTIWAKVALGAVISAT